MKAIFSTGGKQYVAQVGDILHVESLDGDKGSVKDADSVAAVIDKGKVLNGDKAKVNLEIQGHFRDKKIVVFKMKRRKGYRRKQGHRQNMTIVKVKEIKTA